MFCNASTSCKVCAASSYEVIACSNFELQRLKAHAPEILAHVLSIAKKWRSLAGRQTKTWHILQHNGTNLGNLKRKREWLYFKLTLSPFPGFLWVSWSSRSRHCDLLTIPQTFCFSFIKLIHHKTLRLIKSKVFITHK